MAGRGVVVVKVRQLSVEAGTVRAAVVRVAQARFEIGVVDRLILRCDSGRVDQPPKSVRINTAFVHHELIAVARILVDQLAAAVGLNTAE